MYDVDVEIFTFGKIKMRLLFCNTHREYSANVLFLLASTTTFFSAIRSCGPLVLCYCCVFVFISLENGGELHVAQFRCMSIIGVDGVFCAQNV